MGGSAFPSDEDVAGEERDAVVGVVDFAGLPVVVVVDASVELLDFGRVVVVVVGAFDVDPFVVVVVVDGFKEDGEGAAGFVVDVVAAAGAGALPSSLPGVSSRAWVGPTPGAPAGGATAGGGIRSSRRAYCMIRAKTGADTWPP